MKKCLPCATLLKMLHRLYTQFDLRSYTCMHIMFWLNWPPESSYHGVFGQDVVLQMAARASGSRFHQRVKCAARVNAALCWKAL